MLAEGEVRTECECECAQQPGSVRTFTGEKGSRRRTRDHEESSKIQKGKMRPARRDERLSERKAQRQKQDRIKG